MKKILTTMAALLMLSVSFCQDAQWKAFNNFHHLVSKVLHPVTMGQVQPVKDSSATLLASAKTWQASAVPAAVDASVFKAHIAELVKQCATLDDDVKQKQPDNTLKAPAGKVHETFHALLAACKLKD